MPDEDSTPRRWTDHALDLAFRDMQRQLDSRLSEIKDLPACVARQSEAVESLRGDIGDIKRSLETQAERKGQENRQEASEESRIKATLIQVAGGVVAAGIGAAAALIASSL